MTLSIFPSFAGAHLRQVGQDALLDVLDVRPVLVRRHEHERRPLHDIEGGGVLLVEPGEVREHIQAVHDVEGLTLNQSGSNLEPSRYQNKYSSFMR